MKDRAPWDNLQLKFVSWNNPVPQVEKWTLSDDDGGANDDCDEDRLFQLP